MKRIYLMGVVAMSMALPACDSSSYAVFVTATDIGITADAHTEELHFGYNRAEAFIGPNYVEAGEAPNAFGFSHSNLSAFSPAVKQLYATGDAAALVSQRTAPKPEDVKAGDLTGPRRPMFFGTATSIGFKLGFTANTPTSIRFGFDREELSIIPFQKADPTTTSKDKYSSVLASIDMDQETSTLSNTSMHVTQFFATGQVARNLATDPEIQAIFRQQSKNAVRTAAALVHPVAADLQVRRKNLAAYVRTLNAGQQTQLANALGRPVDEDPFVGILDSISSAETPDAVNGIAQKVDVLFNQSF
jgi:hypothetical protein